MTRFMVENEHTQGVRFKRGSVVLDMGIDLKLIVLFMLIVLAFIYVPMLDQTIIRSALCLVMIIFIPGYVLVAALYPRNDDLEWIERIALSFGLSISIVPLILLVLNYTPWGIHLDPIIASLTIFTMVCIIEANVRRHGWPKEARFSLDLKKVYSEARAELLGDGSRIEKTVTVILVITLLVSIAMVAYVIVMPKQAETYTEFYILGANRSNVYPTTIQAGEDEPFLVGVINHEGRNVTYDLVISLNDSISDTPLYQEPLSVADNQTLEKLVNLTPYHMGKNKELEFLLFADGNMTAPYRECHLWVNVTHGDLR